ncbi:inositol monophosphatase family protein [Nocardia sp. NPDC058519]|uniref:inositol monophosphatase family protein n=1 Tax=unclassified Nocardia TaxID=2637762 RepID=UPI0036635262
MDSVDRRLLSRPRCGWQERRTAQSTAALAGHAERIRMLGTASLDLAWLAQGRTDACVILANKPWDTAGAFC